MGISEVSQVEYISPSHVEVVTKWWWYEADSRIDHTEELGGGKKLETVKYD
jgi:hypothetical protein